MSKSSSQLPNLDVVKRYIGDFPQVLGETPSATLARWREAVRLARQRETAEAMEAATRA